LITAPSRTHLPLFPIGNKSESAKKLPRLVVGRNFELDERLFIVLWTSSGVARTLWIGWSPGALSYCGDGAANRPNRVRRGLHAAQRNGCACSNAIGCDL